MSEGIHGSVRTVEEILMSADSWNAYELLVLEKSGVSIDELTKYCTLFHSQSKAPFELAISNLLAHKKQLSEGNHPAEGAEQPTEPETMGDTAPAPTAE